MTGTRRARSATRAARIRSWTASAAGGPALGDGDLAGPGLGYWMKGSSGLMPSWRFAQLLSSCPAGDHLAETHAK